MIWNDTGYQAFMMEVPGVRVALMYTAHRKQAIGRKESSELVRF